MPLCRPPSVSVSAQLTQHGVDLIAMVAVLQPFFQHVPIVDGESS